MMSVGELLRVCEQRGIDVRVEAGKLVAGPPERLDAETLDLIRQHREELRHALSAGCRQPPTSLEALRKLCPLMWRDVVTSDGKRGLLWSISPHGAVVSFGPGQPLYTLDPCEVEPVQAQSAQGDQS